MTKSTFIAQLKAQSKSDVFSRRLNPATLSASRTALRRAFHTVGADTLEARFPISCLVLSRESLKNYVDANPRFTQYTTCTDLHITYTDQNMTLVTLDMIFRIR